MSAGDMGLISIIVKNDGQILCYSIILSKLTPDQH